VLKLEEIVAGIKYPVAEIGFAVIVVPSKVSADVPPNAPALLYCICVVDPPGEPPPPPTTANANDAVPSSEPVMPAVAITLPVTTNDPVTVKDPVTVNPFVILAEPDTSNFAVGDAIPMPTLPLVLPNITFPTVVSIALKSAAAVNVGLINNPFVIPFAPPVWLIVGVIFKPLSVPVPLVGAKVPENIPNPCSRVVEFNVLNDCASKINPEPPARFDLKLTLLPNEI